MPDKKENPVPDKKYFLEMQSFVETRDDPFIVVDRDYCIRSVNMPFEAQFSFDRTSIVGLKCFEAIHMNGMACHDLGESCPFHRVFNLHQPASCRHTHYTADGRMRRILVKGYPLRDMAGDILMGLSFRPFSERGTGASFPVEKMVGQSEEFLAFMDKLRTAALSSVPVLLNGESGTGKKLAAAYIHSLSDRNEKPFVSIDCSRLSEAVFEKELFGSDKASSSDRAEKKEGLIESANGGTLLLDKVEDMPQGIQHKFMRMLETGEFRRTGGKKSLKADIRIICSTGADLLERVEHFEFRRDLYYRLSVFSIAVPPLRKRLIDVPLLAAEMMARIGRNSSRTLRLTEEAGHCLQTYDYPGNVTELLAILRASAADSSSNIIGMAEVRRHFPLDHGSGQAGSGSSAEIAAMFHSKNFMQDIEGRHIKDMLVKNAGNRRATARALGTSERTLYRKMKHYGIK